ncbi:hypothetical protein IGI04_026750 [Brassica rapa subsp. trilocularis]|uniref:Pectinesterase inhibitor domain-containing protein n=1 Tax=Brassica rapa subsp. trilocularis TaxID=1813537 RepID=A0ABQ7KWY6_BRACM|nr:hypothetical protein IGI04_026750 [Brassica rapa subsp. trilocularis]
MVIDRLIDEKGNERSEIITCGAVQGYNVPETNEDSQATSSFLKAAQFERRALSACEDSFLPGKKYKILWKRAM